MSRILSLKTPLTTVDVGTAFNGKLVSEIRFVSATNYTHNAQSVSPSESVQSFYWSILSGIGSSVTEIGRIYSREAIVHND